MDLEQAGEFQLSNDHGTKAIGKEMADTGSTLESGTESRWRRFLRGVGCWMTFLVTPLGWFCFGRLIRRLEPERLEKGMVLIFTGIEGYSFLNVGALSGMIDGGLDYAVDIVDWTTGNKFLYIYHLRAWNRNKRIAQDLARKVIDYQDRYPGRPVWIVGHSGGGGMALLTAEALPHDRHLTGLILLNAAISPTFDIRPAASRVKSAVWNYHSILDWFFLQVGTTVFGTMDGRHGFAAGTIGFKGPVSEELVQEGKLIQRPWRFEMIKKFNPGDHFGCVHRVFVAEEIVPVIRCSTVDSPTA